ncbi:Atg5p [Kluyveromyces lactis]|uniref:Autophagy protein 5 n=1 Tax=Kluyveromyces lactis (strain ATCC 8585 / CBS 2359 / DSM 70799 / NBRC 1267 / NRRL Y-1140 / WM37) TaxID=284590 RepID=ATG5_KLULA|nr:uncharacterized protein KLLA0_F11363g [Kluyveromyces lactis]Q6CKE2.1 RecName: Full=Autophagy protein 5 [Kluyveromyces lactis NRRL Y-1140]CAG98305.1 KLLA0F11363p [Kluyveromyces lactis]|eukprot:XP_455597.1 uncharacterized protein KLLA0_F11363g [Kluyveromyces lactis]
MEELRERVWHGSLNVEIMLSDSIVVPNTPLSEKCYHIVVLRESFLALYLPAIVRKLGNNVIVTYENPYKQWWFEYDGVPVPWEYPCGVLFDFLCNSSTTSTGKEDDQRLQMWKLKLCHGNKYPPGILPLVDGLRQVKDHWKHQWKQACFILNGSAKRIMSLSIPDFEAFWQSLISRHQPDYIKVREKLLTPNKTKHIPIRVWTADASFLQPSIPANSDTMTLFDVMTSMDIKLQENNRAIIQGIVICSDEDIINLYDLFASIDGFLYVVIK